MQLDTPPVRLWDESRLAINAAEMYERGFSLVTTFEGQPDMWNTKPPLMIWLQVLCMHVFGIGELALRLPSALAGLGTCLLLLLFSKVLTGSYRWGYLGAIILVCSAGFTRYHVLRSGDYDALLVFFTTLYGLSFFAWIEKEFTVKYWAIFCFALLLAVYTKGVGGVLFLPALFIWALFKRKLWTVIKRKEVWLGIFLVIAGIAAYYMYRDSLSPGYLKAVWENELGGRYAAPLEGHGHGFWFYIQYMIEYRQFHPWWIWGLAGIIGIWFYKVEGIRRWLIFCGLLSMQLFLVLSYSKTKLEWYTAPLMPYISLLAAFGLLTVKDIITTWDVSRAGFTRNWLPVAFLLLVVSIPYYRTVKWSYSPGYFDWEEGYYGMSEYFKYAVRKNISVDGFKAVSEGYRPHITFYRHVFKHEGQSIEFVKKESLHTGDKVIADQAEMKEYIERQYLSEIESKYGYTNIYHIKGKRE